MLFEYKLKWVLKSIKWKSLNHVWLFALSPGQNSGVGSLSLLQGIFPNPGIESRSLTLQADSLQLSHKGSPRIVEWLAYPVWADFPDPEIQLGSAALQVDSLPTEPSGKPLKVTFTFWLLQVIYVTLCLINVLHFQFSSIMLRANRAMLKSLSHVRLSNSMDCSRPGSSVHEILQARILEWIGMLPLVNPIQGLNTCLLCLLHWQADSFTLLLLGSPLELTR